MPFSLEKILRFIVIRLSRSVITDFIDLGAIIDSDRYFHAKFQPVTETYFNMSLKTVLSDLKLQRFCEGILYSTSKYFAFI